MFYRWYVIPELIAKMSKKVISDKCWKCDKGHFLPFVMDMPKSEGFLEYDF